HGVQRGLFQRKINFNQALVLGILLICRIHDPGGAGTPTFHLGEEAPPSFLMLSRTGCRVIIQPWVGRATRLNLRGVTSHRFFPLTTSLMTNAPFSRRPAM